VSTARRGLRWSGIEIDIRQAKTWRHEMTQQTSSRSFNRLDANAAPSKSMPRWSETRWNCCWSPEGDVGIYIHAGRYPKDLDLWWVHVAAYLRDGKLAVDRFWCRNPAEAGIRSDNLLLEMTTNGWRTTFDGVGQLTDTAELVRTTRGSSAPTATLKWDVVATEAAPVWDMFDSVDSPQDFASDLHIQQAATTTGSLWIDGVEYSLEGVGFKDHSSGARSFGTWNSHRFLQAVMPDWTVHAVTIMRDDDTAGATMGKVMAGGEQQPVKVFEGALLTSPTGEPKADILTVTGPSGPVSLSAEVIHCLPITITEDNDNFNGIDWDIAGDPMVMVEAIVRLTAEDGAVGYGFLERSARQSVFAESGVRSRR
jgi:hypothetical protein